jgi:Rrf2 family protein
VNDGLRTLLRREESYAIHALIYASDNPGASAAAMARDLEMPPAFLAKVLRRLVDAGLLTSRMGRRGGVRPAGDTANVTLLDVIEAVSGPFVMDTCQAEAACVTTRRTGRCHLNLAYHVASAEIRRVLAGVRVGDLAGDGPAAAGRPAATGGTERPDAATPDTVPAEGSAGSTDPEPS